jgi:hypothetical protein
MRSVAAWSAVVVSSLLATSSAWAVPVPAELRAGAARITVTDTEGGARFELRRGTRRIDSWVVPNPLSDVTVEEVSSAGRTLFLVHATGSGEWVALIDARPRVVWRGRLDLHGDPGERVADALERRDIDGDGRADLVTGQRREGVAPCGEPPQLLFPRAIDAGGALRPVQPVVAVDGLPVLTAVGAADRAPPRAAGLRFTASSSSRGGPEDAALLGPPIGLTDGDLSTGWSEGRAGSGDGEVLRAQWMGPAITGLTLHAASGDSMPRRIVLRLDSSAVMVSLPPSVGNRAFVALPMPVRASCLSITLAEGTPRSAESSLGFTEISAYSLVDEEGGLVALIDLLVADASDGDRAVDWLASTGESSLEALDSSWERLGARGRRRAMRVASALQRDGSPEARAQIRALRARAARDEDLEVRGDAIGALVRGDEGDLAALFDVAIGEPAEAPLAAVALARGRVIPGSASASLARLTRAHWDRPALRSAVARSVASVPSWRAAAEAPSLDAHGLAALALGLREARSLETASAASEPLVAALVVRALATREATDDFVVRFRLARASREVSSPEVLAWLDSTARGADEWMLRAEAIEALGARASRELLGVLLIDHSPRVRLAAARVLVRRGREIPTLLALARSDSWPLVRGYALAEIADSAEGRAAILDALRDPASAMRARALELLRTRVAPDLDVPLAGILEDDLEWPHVTDRALEVAEARCSETLGSALVRVVARGVQRDARPGHLEAAQRALYVALRFGGPTASSARAAAVGPASQTFETLLAHPPPPCGALSPAGAVPDPPERSERSGVPSEP